MDDQLYENHNLEQQKHYLPIFAHTLWSPMMTDLYFLHFLERKSPPNILVQAFPSSAVTFPFSRLEIKLVLKPVTSAKYAYVYPIRFLCCCIAFPKSTTLVITAMSRLLSILRQDSIYTIIEQLFLHKYIQYKVLLDLRSVARFSMPVTV